jgi:STAS-like domain of unknown function (DUF4325)
MHKFELSVAKDFSPSPAGRYIEDGPFPGAVFRDNMLVPALKSNDQVTVNLDGTDGYGSSFLEEAFGGLIRLGFSEKDLIERLKIESTRKSYSARVWTYIKKHDM